MDKMMLDESTLRKPCTILLPIYNAAKFINRSIENISQLAGPEDEILIVNDGSTDGSNLEIEKYKKLDSRIIVHNREHRGLVDSLNYGIRMAKHEFIARVDVDDTYTIDRISEQVKFLANNPDISAVFSDYRMQNSSGEKLGLFPSAIFPELTAFSLINSQRTAHPSVMYRKTAVLAAGCYKQEDFPAEDLALWIRLTEKGNIASLPKVLLNYTVHNAGITQSKQTAMRAKSIHLRKNFASNQINKEILENIEKLLSRYRGYSYRNVRVLFFLEDLFTFDRFTSGTYRKKIFIITLRQLISRNIFLVPAFIYLIFMKIKRQKVI